MFIERRGIYCGDVVEVATNSEQSGIQTKVGLRGSYVRGLSSLLQEFREIIGQETISRNKIGITASKRRAEEVRSNDRTLQTYTDDDFIAVQTYF